MGDPDPYRPEPGDGAREAQRAAGIEREEREGVAPAAGMLDRLAAWLRSRFGRR
jgi:hypothetical protein